MDFICGPMWRHRGGRPRHSEGVDVLRESMPCMLHGDTVYACLRVRHLSRMLIRYYYT